MKIKHKPDREGFQENEVDEGLQGFLQAILDCKEFQLDWKGIESLASPVSF